MPLGTNQIDCQSGYSELNAEKPQELEVLIRQKSKGLTGNQQERRAFILGWLVGMIEGEGCITLNRTGVTKTKFGTKIGPYISITNMNDLLIQKAIEYIKELELPFHLYIRKGVLRIEIFGQRRVKKWLELIKPFLVGKKQQAEQVLNFIKLREKVIDKHPFKKPYSLEEVKIWDEVHKLNSNKENSNPQRLYARTLLEQERVRYSLNSNESLR